MNETHNFTLVVRSKLDLPALEDVVFEAGCDDAILVQRAGTIYLEFDRQCTSLEVAILTAIEALDVAGVETLRIEPDDLVSAAEIARHGGEPLIWSTAQRIGTGSD